MTFVHMKQLIKLMVILLCRRARPEGPGTLLQHQPPARGHRQGSAGARTVPAGQVPRRPIR